MSVDIVNCDTDSGTESGSDGAAAESRSEVRTIEMAVAGRGCDAVKAHVGIEQCAKSVDEGDGADPGRRTRTRAALAYALLHRTQEEVQPPAPSSATSPTPSPPAGFAAHGLVRS